MINIILDIKLNIEYNKQHLILLIMNIYLFVRNLLKLYYIYFMGIGDWGLGIGDWGLGIWAKTQNPKTTTQKPKTQKYKILKKKIKF